MDVIVDSDSDKENNAYTETNVSDEEHKINNEVPIDVFVPALQLEKGNHLTREITTLSFSLKQLTYRTKERRKISFKYR